MGAVSFFLVFLAIVLIGATLWAGTGGSRGLLQRFRRSTAPDSGRTAPDAGTDGAAAPAGPDHSGAPAAGTDVGAATAGGSDSPGTEAAEQKAARPEAPAHGLLFGGFEQPPANLPPVLLPAEAAPADIDRVRFSLGLRGYRMDQVDQVLDELRDQLAAKDEEVARLRARLADPNRADAHRTDADQMDARRVEAESAASPESGP